MFGYAPTVNDESGAILGQGVMGSANTRAQAQVGLVDDIGSSLVSLAAAYGQQQGTKAKGKNFKKFMGMAGDTFGMDSAMFGDMDDYDAGMMLENFAPMMPAMANAQLGQRRNQTAQQGQFIQQRMPDLRAQTNANNRRLQEGPVISGPALPSFE